MVSPIKNNIATAALPPATPPGTNDTRRLNVLGVTFGTASNHLALRPGFILTPDLLHHYLDHHSTFGRMYSICIINIWHL
jgi:hypothetical protein